MIWSDKYIATPALLLPMNLFAGLILAREKAFFQTGAVISPMAEVWHCSVTTEKWVNISGLCTDLLERSGI